MRIAPAPRSLTVGFLIGLAASFALLLAHFTLQWPTSDVRARLYVMLATWPYALSASYFAMAFIVAALAAALAGVLDRWALLGVSLAAGVAVIGLWLHLYSWLVWLHEEDMTAAGVSTRITIAVTVGVGAIMLARRDRLARA